MFRKNKRSLQPLLVSHVSELPSRSKKLLEGSWAATFRTEVFGRIREERFAVLYADCPSRPNVPVNVLMGLEILKAGRGWSDEELYEHFVFDLQVRYALGCDNFGEGDFDLRTLYYFRRALSKYALENGINLVALTFTDITDQQLKALEIKTGMQRMDSTDIASNIADLSRLELLITVMQRLYRILSEADQNRYCEKFAPYNKEGAGQYTYRIKGREAVWANIQQVGELLHSLLQQLQKDYGQTPVYATAQRFFEENFKLTGAQVQAKANKEIHSGCLQSVDDLEASYRVKNHKGYKGYVANLSETCDPSNPLQLVTQASVAPNRTYDAQFLQSDIPAIKERMELNLLVTDSQYLGPQADAALQAGNVTQISTALTGAAPDRSNGKLSLVDFELTLEPSGEMTSARCPTGQTASIRVSKKGASYRLDFDLTICQACPFYAQQCPIQTSLKQPLYWLSVSKARAASSQRRRRFEQTKEQARNLRPAIEATMFQLTHKLRRDKLLVRGLVRVTQMVLCAVLALNLRRIDRFRKNKQRGKLTHKNYETPNFSSLILFVQRLFLALQPFQVVLPSM